MINSSSLLRAEKRPPEKNLFTFPIFSISAEFNERTYLFYGEGQSIAICHFLSKVCGVDE